MVKTLNIHKKGRLLKAAREKRVTYKSKVIKITVYFSTETLKTKGA
jgi:hypothetical protein